MHKTYKTFDYSHIPINEIEDKDLCNLAKISNLSIKELCDGKDNNLLIFPDKLDKYKDGIADSCIFTIDKQKLHTGDLLGFIGVNNSQVTISSRFAKNDNEDYFLHYMLQKVFNINLLNLQHSTSDNQIFDFLAYMFPFYLKRALKQGIYKQYIKKEQITLLFFLFSFNATLFLQNLYFVKMEYFLQEILNTYNKQVPQD